MTQPTRIFLQRANLGQNSAFSGIEMQDPSSLNCYEVAEGRENTTANGRVMPACSQRRLTCDYGTGYASTNTRDLSYSQLKLGATGLFLGDIPKPSIHPILPPHIWSNTTSSPAEQDWRDRGRAEALPKARKRHRNMAYQYGSWAAQQQNAQGPSKCGSGGKASRPQADRECVTIKRQ